MLDLVKLEQFVVIVQSNSFSTASEKLHLSQSALTRSIARLEAELGTQLLHRSRGRNGVVPTDSGYILLIHAQELLRNSYRIESEMAAVTPQSTQTVRFAMGPMVASIVLDNLPPEFLQSNRHIAIVIEPAEVLMAQLLAGEIEFYVGLTPSGGVPLSVQPRLLGAGPPRLLVRPGHPLMRSGAVPIERALEFPRVSGSQWNRTVADTAPDLLTRRVFTASVEIDNFDALARLAHESDAIVLSAFRPGRAMLSSVQTEVELRLGQSELYLFTVRGVSPTALAAVAHSWIEQAFVGLVPE